MGKYDFDEFIDRSNTNSMNVEGWRSYIFGADCDTDSVRLPPCGGAGSLGSGTSIP